MKYFFQTVGVISLVVFSFILTEKTTIVMKENDEIMIKINSIIDDYKKEAINASIKDNYIIPGIYGESVNVDRSYNNMKKSGYFSEFLLEFDKVKPEISVDDNYDKYIISGNKKKGMVSLIFLVDRNDDIDNILNILNEKEVFSDFFLDGYWMEDNNEKLIVIKNKGHDVGSLGYNMNYDIKTFMWLDTIIKSVIDQKFNYCYNTENDSNVLDICSERNNYTIKPSFVIRDNYLKTIKENINSGNIIALEVTDELKKELPLIINYINSKGYKIETLKEHLKEDF